MKGAAIIPAAIVTLSLAAAMPAAAQNAASFFEMPPPEAQIPPPAIQVAPTEPQTPIDQSVAFSRSERWLIPYYFTKLRSQRKHASRSKGEKRELPEGLTKSPEIGETLPLSLLPELRLLPKPLTRELPPRRPDTQRYVIGSDVVLVRPSTGEVLDKLPNVI